MRRAIGSLVYINDVDLLISFVTQHIELTKVYFHSSGVLFNLFDFFCRKYFFWGVQGCAMGLVCKAIF